MDINRRTLLALWITLLGLVQLAGGAWLRCYKGSLDDYLVAELDKPLTPSFSACINRTLPTVVYTFGYRGRTNGPATTAVLTAYIKKRKRNVLLLDWEEEAKSGLLGIPLGYTFYAVPNAKRVGRELGDMVVRLAASGVNMTGLHLMGHSLGAHIMGLAGRTARAQGHVVARVTGLDPARALFEGRLSWSWGVARGAARLVDIIHTDPGGYGAARATGNVDIWPNYGAGDIAQPGCPTGEFDMFTPEDLCSHDRSWRYYVESISSPTAFPAARAAGHHQWAAGGGGGTIYLGELTSARAQGNYYLTTNPSAPFGRGAEGLKPSSEAGGSTP